MSKGWALGIIAAIGSTAPTLADDFTDFDAKAVMAMPSEQRVGYLAGVIEGLAYARYVGDGNTTEGMSCVYDWFYDHEGQLETIHAAFERWPDYQPGAIIGLLVERACPR